jgi:hypothetical protein
MARTCLFCEARATTREHVVPRWARSSLATGEPEPIRQLITVGTEQPIERRRTRLLFSDTAKVACATCNNRWMSRLETNTRAALIPMIHGESTLLDRNAQRTLAAWALKTASVADHAQGDPWQPTSMEAERRHLAEFGEPSANVLVWLAARLDPPPAQIYLWGSTAIPTAPAGELDCSVIYGATIALGPVVLEVLYTTAPQLSVAYALEERPAINLIWPYRAPFDRGEREEFDDEGFSDYMNALPSVLRSMA